MWSNIYKKYVKFRTTRLRWWRTNSGKLLTLNTYTKSLPDLIEVILSKTEKLVSHDYIARSQEDFLRNLKQSAKETEMIALLDFAENYSFMVQDAAQGYHWDNTHCTLHPFVLYYRNNIGECIKYWSHFMPVRRLCCLPLRWSLVDWIKSFNVRWTWWCTSSIHASTWSFKIIQMATARRCVLGFKMSHTVQNTLPITKTGRSYDISVTDRTCIEKSFQSIILQW